METVLARVVFAVAALLMLAAGSQLVRYGWTAGVRAQKIDAAPGERAVTGRAAVRYGWACVLVGGTLIMLALIVLLVAILGGIGG